MRFKSFAIFIAFMIVVVSGCIGENTESLNTSESKTTTTYELTSVPKVLQNSQSEGATEDSEISSTTNKPNMHECSVCGGDGWVSCSTCGGTGVDQDESQCPVCGGSGGHPCENCDGDGILGN